MNNKVKYGFFVLLVLCAGIGLFFLKNHDWGRTKALPAPNLAQQMIDTKLANITALASDVKILIRQTDSLKMLAPRVEHHWHTVVDQSMDAAPDTCRYYINAVKLAFLSSDSLKNKIIAKQDSTITKQSKALTQYVDVLTLKDYFYNQRGDTINTLKEDLHRTKKKLRNAKIGGWIKTAVGTAAGVFGGRASSKVIP